MRLQSRLVWSEKVRKQQKKIIDSLKNRSWPSLFLIWLSFNDISKLFGWYFGINDINRVMFCFYFKLWAESMKYMYYIFCIINLQVMLWLNYHIQYHESETSTDGDDAPERYGCHQRVNNAYFIQNTKLKSSLCRNYS